MTITSVTNTKKILMHTSTRLTVFLQGFVSRNIQYAIHKNGQKLCPIQRNQDFNIFERECAAIDGSQTRPVLLSSAAHNDLSHLQRLKAEYSLKYPGSQSSRHHNQPFDMRSDGSQMHRLTTALHPSDTDDNGTLERRQSFPEHSQRHGFTLQDNSAASRLFIPPKRDLPFPTAREIPRSTTSESQVQSEVLLNQSSHLKSTTDLSFVPVIPSLDQNSLSLVNPSPPAAHVAPEPPKPITPITQSSSSNKPKRTVVAKRVPAKNNSIPPPAQADSDDLQARAEDHDGQDISKTVPLLHARYSADEPSPLASKSASIERPSTAPGLLSKAPPVKKRAPAAPRQRAAAAKKQKMIDSSTQTMTQAGREHTALMTVAPPMEQSGTPIVHVAPVVSVVSPGIQPPTENPPVTYLEAIDDFVLKHKSGPAPVELWQRPSWSDGTDEERQNLLNDFLVECLDDPNFLQLCEDVDNSWRRIGIGM